MTNKNQNTDAQLASREPTSVLRRFIARLQRQHSHPTGTLSSELAQHLAALTLAETSLCDLVALQEQPERPFQVAVLGPTQVGKSTVVNLLLGQQVAETSPLAGFTIHPHGFAVNPPDGGAPWLKAFFPGWQRCPEESLSSDQLECYTLHDVHTGVNIHSGMVVWDTPDFDSLRAHRYQRGVLAVAAHADVIVLVLSREKYADLSVWKTVQLLLPLRRPLLICLNKVTDEAREPVLHALYDRLASMDLLASEVSEVITLPQQTGLDGLTEAALPVEVEQLRASLRRAVDHVDRSRRTHGVQKLILHYWPEWTAPLVSELSALKSWEEAVDSACTQALASYREEFLDHPQRFDTFRRAILELLQLLELPGFAQSLTRIRQVLTWPARRLYKSRTVRRLRGRISGQAVHDLPGEELVLRDLLEQLLTTLSRDALRHHDSQTPAGSAWQALSMHLAEHERDLKHRFDHVVHQHYLDFQPEIEAAAHELYATLQQRPALLNTLRAARASTDLAAIALAVKTGGIGLNDLLFAPAMVSLTSMLTEGAVGTYMTTVARRLKEKQFATVEQQVFHEAVEQALKELAHNLSAPGLLGISEGQFQTAQQALETWTDDGNDQSTA